MLTGLSTTSFEEASSRFSDRLDDDQLSVRHEDVSEFHPLIHLLVAVSFPFAARLVRKSATWVPSTDDLEVKLVRTSDPAMLKPIEAAGRSFFML